MAHATQPQSYFTSDPVDLFCYTRDRVIRRYCLRPSRRGVGEVWLFEQGADGVRSEQVLLVDRPEACVDALMILQRTLVADGWMAT